MNELAQPLKNRKFLLVWSSQLISSLGDAILPMAFAVHLVRSGHDISSLGLIFASRGLAMVAVMFIGGILADRFQKAHIMRLSDLARFLLLIWLILCISNSSISALVVISFLFGIFEALFRPAFRSITPLLVGEKELKTANALGSISSKTVGVLGPILAGVLVSVTSVQFSLVIDAFTFLVSFLMLGGASSIEVADTKRRSITIEVLDTFRFLKSKLWLSSQLIGGLIQMPLAVAPWFVLLPTISSQHFGTTTNYGVLLSFYALGGIAGALIASKWSPQNKGTISMISVSLFSLPLLSLAFNTPLSIALVAHFIGGCGLEIYAVYWYTALQNSVQPEYLGRILSLDMTAGALLMPIAYAMTGPYISLIGSSTVLMIGAIACLLTTIPLLCIAENRKFSEVY